MRQRITWLALYVIAVFLPLIIILVFQGGSYHGFGEELGKALALTAFMIAALQGVLAARFKIMERPFGLDLMLRYHRHMGLLALGLLIVHPVVIAAAEGEWSLLYSLSLPWYIWVGKITLLLTALLVLVSVFQLRLGLKYEKWRLGHNVVAPLILVGGFTHSIVVGNDFYVKPLLYFWILALAVAVIVFAYHRLIRTAMVRRRTWEVVDVSQTADRVWTVKLQPPEGESVFDYYPGQFQFITFFSDALPVEEHHWTISSSPTESGFVTSTIKELGDFTADVGRLKPGDRAAVHAPFGRFSHRLYPDEPQRVFIAGGIGITPVRSMLRYMADSSADAPATLIYANQTEGDVAFRSELDDIGRAERINVVHVLGEPPEGWTGESGYVDRNMIERLVGPDEIGRTYFYLCGPPGLIDAVLKALGELGVPDDRIHLEIFSFLS
jgi:predicted ferric reductase